MEAVLRGEESLVGRICKTVKEVGFETVVKE